MRTIFSRRFAKGYQSLPGYVCRVGHCCPDVLRLQTGILGENPSGGRRWPRLHRSSRESSCSICGRRFPTTVSKGGRPGTRGSSHCFQVFWT